MSLFITDGERGAFELTRAGLRSLDCPLDSPCCPCACARRRYCACPVQRDLWEASSGTRMPAVPGICALCCSPCGRYLYQLGGDADSVHTCHADTGELLFAARQGVFPRGMKLIDGGNHLLIAGGASSDAIVLTAPELREESRYEAFGAVCAADVWREGLVLLCAVESGDIQTVLAVISERRPREIARFAGQAGGLCVLADGRTALVGALEGVWMIDLTTGARRWCWPQMPLCARIECAGDIALMSDSLGGRVMETSVRQPWNHRCVYSGREAQATFAYDSP